MSHLFLTKSRHSIYVLLVLGAPVEPFRNASTAVATTKPPKEHATGRATVIEPLEPAMRTTIELLEPAVHATQVAASLELAAKPLDVHAVRAIERTAATDLAASIELAA